jgi:hypothetical protein
VEKLMMRSCAVIVLTIVFGVGALGAQSSKPSTPVAIAEAFFAHLAKGETRKGYDDLFVGSPMTAQPTQVEALKRQTDTAIALYGGKVLGVELHEERKIGTSLVRLVYVQRLQRHPLIWTIWFYRPSANWQVNQIVFNDQLLIP